MASIAIMIAGAVLNATAFVGGSYLAKSLSGGDASAERVRHDKALEEYQRDIGEWEKKRKERRDLLEAKYAEKERAESFMRETDKDFVFYDKTHPDVKAFLEANPKPKFSDYYKPSERQKQYEMIYVGGGMLALGYVISKVI